MRRSRGREHGDRDPQVPPRLSEQTKPGKANTGLLFWPMVLAKCYFARVDLTELKSVAWIAELTGAILCARGDSALLPRPVCLSPSHPASRPRGLGAGGWGRHRQAPSPSSSVALRGGFWARSAKISHSFLLLLPPADLDRFIFYM